MAQKNRSRIGRIQHVAVEVMKKRGNEKNKRKNWKGRCDREEKRCIHIISDKTREDTDDTYDRG